MVKESIGLLRMLLMTAKYWKLKTKIKKHALKMAEYVAGHEFQTLEAREQLRNIYRIYEKESRE